MSLRKKTLVYGGLTLIGLLAALNIVSRLILLDRFNRLEQEHARADVARVLEALDAERANLLSSTVDYAAWDDIYAFAEGEYPDFPEINIDSGVLANLRLNLALIVNCSGETLFQTGFDLVTEQEIAPPAGLLPRLDPLGLLSCPADPQQTASGVILLEPAPLLVAAHPIVTNEYQGPARGLLIFGRSLDAIEVKRLANVTHLPVRLQNPAEAQLPSRDEIQTRVIDANNIAGFGLVNDPLGNPALVFRLDLPRQIYQQGQRTLTYQMWALHGVGLLFTLMFLFPIENLLLRRLSRLNRGIQQISASRDRGARLDESGRDEISGLASEINCMLAALDQSEQRLVAERRNILSVIPDLLFVVSRQGRVVEVKADQEYFLGVPVAEIAGRHLAEFGFSAASLQFFDAQIDRALDSGGVQLVEKSFNIQERAVPQAYDFEFRLVGLSRDEVLVIARDITERKHIEAELRRQDAMLVEQNEELQATTEALRASAQALQDSEERYMLAVRGANDGLWDWDLTGNQVYFSPRWKAMLGYAEGEISTGPEEWFGRVHPEEQEQVRRQLSTHLSGITPHFESEHRMRHKHGSYRWVLARGLTVRSGGEDPAAPKHPERRKGHAGRGPIWPERGTAVRMAGSMADITERKQAEQQLLHDAFHDSLTGLPNRALFTDRLGRAIEHANHQPESHFAVLFLDLDRFKVVNDSLGHTTGDKLLVALAGRLTRLLRSGDTVARLGGDEFVMLLENLPKTELALNVARRILDELVQPFQLEGHSVVVAASIGVISSTAGYEHPAEVLRDADIAMYRAKALGKNRYEVFDASFRTRAITRLELENELRQAFENRQLYLCYQPIHALADDRLIGFEALLRWQSPTRGNIPPLEFIPVAEETGLIIPIGQWVLQEACAQVVQWQAAYPMEPPLAINVNISGVQFSNAHFLGQIEATLAETGLAPGSLKLEITESVFLENAAHANELLLKLRDLGVQIQIDDFGTGYSSLAYLQNFPIHTIKIDRSFVARMSRGATKPNGHGSEIVKTIVTLAHDLGMESVAEGIETLDQLELLKELNCQYGQGYLLARPLIGEEAGQLAAQASADVKPPDKTITDP